VIWLKMLGAFYLGMFAAVFALALVAKAE